jgi:two-component system, response regulator RegA
MSDRRGTALLVEDDPRTSKWLEGVLGEEEFTVTAVSTVSALRSRMREGCYDLSIVDLRLPDGPTLEFLAARDVRSRFGRTIVFSGHLTVALTWAAARKWNVEQVIAKPATTAEIVRAIRGLQIAPCHLELGSHRRTLALLERERIDRVLLENGGNISQTARELGMHRQVLQRKLRKNLVP